MSSKVQLARQREKLTPLANPVAVIGTKTVVCSGTIVSRGSEPVSFMPFDGSASNFYIALTFQNSSGGSPALEISYPENNVSIKFINMNSVFGQSTSLPVPMFMWDGDVISINIAYHTIGEGENATRVVNYTVFNSAPLKPDTD